VGQREKMKRDPLIRVKKRPRPEDWADDEALTLREAVALFFPDGPLTISSLRREAAVGRLATARVAGKDFVTPQALKDLFKPCRAEKTPARNPEGVAAQERARKTLDALKAKHRPPRRGR